MADEEELYLANLDEFVNDENRIVTYKWLSRTLSVPANRAKRMLFAFVEKQKGSKTGSELNVTYLIGGKCSVGGDTVHRFVISQDEKLEETKKNFSLVTSLHIYSVQKCKLKDSNSLYTVDYDVQQQHHSDTNRWSHIHCSAAVPQADQGVNGSAHLMNGVTDGNRDHGTKMANGTGEVHSFSRGASTSAFDQKSKTATSKPRKGQLPTLEMFSTKSTSKTDRHISEKPPAGQNGKDNQADQKKPNSNNKGGSKLSFFGKSTLGKKASEKPSTAGNDKEVNRPTGEKASEKPSTEGNEKVVKPAKSQTAPKKQDQAAESRNSKKRELSSEDEEEPLPAKISKVVNSSVVGKQKQKEDKPADVSKGKARKKKAVINEESDEEREVKPKKRRKRTKELPKEDSSDDEQDVLNGDVSKRLSPDKGSSSSVSPPPQQRLQQTENGSARRRKRTKTLKDKTYMNDEGFMVTEKVYEIDSTDASDEEPQETNPPENEKQPSPAEKIIKKTCADVKTKAAKQSSLTSFFKKS